ncbi:protease modulator HflC [Ureibacillus chungkukjangi]|uniref:Protein HflC n=1 Tax=Ureibacillus chungkukjangi TaxID=1202712 RepID=A0A318UAC4_9BACL|nr:protease modulator HflC [Ureibacillus chungkukjangi]MCM3387488.1 protease modulator HflC [Ureibacillus chungkukjangi]PYF09029.1 protease FtsH subunit HflC [Ureibacillus chungkukjangi]
MSNNNNQFDGDLEKVAKSLFGNNKNKKKNSNDPNDTKIVKEKKPFNGRQFAKSAILLTAIFAVIIIVIGNVYVVKENEYKVVRQFGEVVKYEEEPGLNIKIPFIQSVTTLPKNLMTYEMTQEEINTLDKKRIIIDNYAVWRVTDPKSLISNAGTLINAESRMEEYIYSVLRTQLGQLNYDQIINDENSERGSINDRVTEEVNKALENGNFGIAVVDVRIRRTDLPQENEQSVYTRMISERESIAQRYLSEGDAVKNERVAQTDREVSELIATANKDAAVIRAQGEAEAAKIYNSAFSRDPEFYGLYRTLESYKKTIGEDTVIILPSNSPYARILSGYLE